MATMESLKDAISKERAQRETYVAAELLPMVRLGKGQEALESLVFFTHPGELEPRLRALQQRVTHEFAAADTLEQRRYLGFLSHLVLALRSFLPRWNLQNDGRHSGAALGVEEMSRIASRVAAQVSRLEHEAPQVAAGLLAHWRSVTAARFAAEDAEDPESEALQLTGSSVCEYLENLSARVAESNLRLISEMRHAGQTLTEISNDYAAFLQYALYLGASFATTNPPLVDYAWLADTERWNPVADGIVSGNPGASADELARLMTMEVVLANMRLLRPIFLLTCGGMGCVCLQVNPHNHSDAAAMVSDAESLYGRLREKLGGGVPNVVFKLPGTNAGLAACRALTAQGIGVTITVNFGMFQHIPFAEAIREGQAIFACLVEMNGRLAFPVRDELLGKLDELAAHGIDEARAREAAAWAGVAPIKRAYALLGKRGYDLRRIKPLIASLRIYEGEAYASLPSAFPDMTEILGASLLSVFPNVRRAFDATPALALDPKRIESPVPEEALEVLVHSEVFRQAYYVANRDWVPDEDARFRPEYELTLGDEEAVYAWPPVYNTMTQFRNAYDTFVERILERRQVLAT